MPVWKLIVTDLLLTVVFLGIFSYYHLVVPRTMHGEKEIIVATAQDSEENTFILPGNELAGNKVDNENFKIQGEESGNSTDNNSEVQFTDKSKVTQASNIDTDRNSNKDSSDKAKRSDGKRIYYGNTNTMEIASDTSSSKVNDSEEAMTEINRYQGVHIQFTTNKVELGSGSDKITYYRSDIYVTNVKYIKTAFATGDYGKNLKASTSAMAEDNDALLAISGDFYGNGETGVVIRNGILYRSVENDADICVLFIDGTMKTYSPEEFDADEVLEQGAWQAWTFGPELLDGKGHILASFNTTTYLNSTNPRCAIGYVEPGHYIFVVVDGRDEGYSMGVTLSELSQIMVKAGCESAYNLDGGKSAAMVFDGGYVNQPAQGGRTISDIIYIGE
ncbi:MAG: hypothetical protein K0R34_3071 [Herbinix sp.]|nr:hypothetical protein [Herbinix sp.]